MSDFLNNSALPGRAQRSRLTPEGAGSRVGAEMAESLRAGRATPARFWPFTSQTAVLLVPLLLTVQLVAWGLIRYSLGLDTVRTGSLLLGVVSLSLLPLILLLLEGLALTGGSIEVGSIKVALTAAASAQPLVVATRNVAPGTDVTDADSEKFFDGLRRTRSATVVVVSLEDGHAWWETRLLILCASAVRSGMPEVMAFTASRQGKPAQFVGWGHPVEILQRLLDANAVYRDAYDRAMGYAVAARMRHALGADAKFVLPPHKLRVVYPAGPDKVNAFLEEQLLADELRQQEVTPREIGVGTLTDMLDPVLRAGSVDRTDLDSEWFRKALRADEGYVAVTDSGTYVALMTRADLVSEVLLAVTET